MGNADFTLARVSLLRERILAMMSDAERADYARARRRRGDARAYHEGIRSDADFTLDRVSLLRERILAMISDAERADYARARRRPNPEARSPFNG
jgi:hypothetical protein